MLTYEPILLGIVFLLFLLVCGIFFYCYCFGTSPLDSSTHEHDTTMPLDLSIPRNRSSSPPSPGSSLSSTGATGAPTFDSTFTTTPTPALKFGSSLDFIFNGPDNEERFYYYQRLNSFFEQIDNNNQNQIRTNDSQDSCVSECTGDATTTEPTFVNATTSEELYGNANAITSIGCFLNATTTESTLSNATTSNGCPGNLITTTTTPTTTMEPTFVNVTTSTEYPLNLTTTASTSTTTPEPTFWNVNSRTNNPQFPNIPRLSSWPPPRNNNNRIPHRNNLLGCSTSQLTKVYIHKHYKFKSTNFTCSMNENCQPLDLSIKSSKASSLMNGQL